jgi:nucleoside-triphosphatase
MADREPPGSGSVRRPARGREVPSPEADDLRDARRILLTGRPGVGKTTVVRRTLDLLESGTGAAGRSVVEGFLTEEIRDPAGVRAGFRIRSLRGDSGTLARVGLRSPVRVGRYGVDLESIDAVVNSMLDEVLAGPGVDLLVLDEIGKMESASARFRDLVDRAFDSRIRILGTVPIRATGWIDEIERRPDVVRVEVTRENRDELPGRLAASLARSRLRS